VELLGVAIGGGAGALARYILEGVIAQRQQSPFPLSTLVINVTGSIVLGVLVGLVVANNLSSGVLVWGGTGFLGGYTTFSTFTYETLRLIEDGVWRYAAMNVLFSAPLSFGGAALAYALFR
jgi:CrcB protein